MSILRKDVNLSKPLSVFLYAANIIDYSRVILIVIAFYYAKHEPIIFLVLYSSAFALDLFDGMAARFFKQTSKLGATMDMIIDRVSTAGLLVILSNFYPEHYYAFIFLMMLDISSHWMQTHSGLIDPRTKNKNHKGLDEKSWVLNFYYKNKYNLLVICLGAEVYLLSIYSLHFNKELMNSLWFEIFLYTSFLIYAFKQYISIMQLISSSRRIARFDQ